MKPKAAVRLTAVRSRRRADAKSMGTSELARLSAPHPFLVHTLRLRSRKPPR